MRSLGMTKSQMKDYPYYAFLEYETPDKRRIKKEFAVSNSAVVNLGNEIRNLSRTKTITDKSDMIRDGLSFKKGITYPLPVKLHFYIDDNMISNFDLECTSGLKALFNILKKDSNFQIVDAVSDGDYILP